MTAETVVATSIQMPDGDAMAEVSIGVRHADGRNFWRPATWAEIEKIERELPGWKDQLVPQSGPALEVPFFSSKDWH